MLLGNREQQNEKR